MAVCVCFDTISMMVHRDDVCCLRAVKRWAWRCEINQDYALYVATLRSKRDAEYLADKRDRVYRRLKEEQISNINLRREVRGMEREIETMCHKNAQKSCVVDGLQELDEKFKSTKFLNSENLETKHLEEMICLLRSDISLLRSKKESDSPIIRLLQPRKVKLKDLLDTLILEDHQKVRRYLKDMHAWFKRVEQFHLEFDDLLSSYREKRIWIEESFQKLDSTSLERSEEMQVKLGCMADGLVGGVSNLRELRCDQYLIKDYIERLDFHRKKQEPRVAHENNSQCLDEMEIILNIHEGEGRIISRFLTEYSRHISEDFRLNKVYGKKLKYAQVV